jgi:hypothetical protein
VVYGQLKNMNVEMRSRARGRVTDAMVSFLKKMCSGKKRASVDEDLGLSEFGGAHRNVEGVDAKTVKTIFFLKPISSKF